MEAGLGLTLDLGQEVVADLLADLLVLAVNRNWDGHVKILLSDECVTGVVSCSRDETDAGGLEEWSIGARQQVQQMRQDAELLIRRPLSWGPGGGTGCPQLLPGRRATAA